MVLKKNRFIFNYINCVFLFLVIFVVFLLYKADISDYYSNYNAVAYIKNNISVDAEEISKCIHLCNKDENIKNVEEFGPITEDVTILVILVNKFSSRLNVVVSSLAHIKGIEEALVIFSHSFFDEEMNRVIKSIDFCRVWQIYYPYSIQVNPNRFPGYDAGGCSRDSYFRANCSLHGRFRNPIEAEKKHHWWWTVNNIFENLSSTLKHTGLVIFSDDSFIFMKDFIYMVSYMREIAMSLPQCEILSLGSDITPAEPTIIDLQDIYSVQLNTWNLKEHSRVLAFDMSVWNSIVSHYDVFCTLDDTSWLRSLYFISLNRRDGISFKALSAVTPRAFKIDSCPKSGYFYRTSCELEKNVLIINDIEGLNDEKWFPPYLELYINVELDDDDVIFDYSEGDARWADPRDWALCRNMTGGKIKKILMEMRNEFHEYLGGKS